MTSDDDGLRRVNQQNEVRREADRLRGAAGGAVAGLYALVDEALSLAGGGERDRVAAALAVLESGTAQEAMDGAVTRREVVMRAAISSARDALRRSLRGDECHP